MRDDVCCPFIASSNRTAAIELFNTTLPQYMAVCGPFTCSPTAQPRAIRGGWVSHLLRTRVFLQCCDWQMRQPCPVQPVFSTHVPSLPGAISHVCPKRAQAPAGAGPASLVERSPDGVQLARTMTTLTKPRAKVRMDVDDTSEATRAMAKARRADAERRATFRRAAYARANVVS